MKTKLRVALVGIALLGLVSVSTVKAEDTNSAAASHEGHHPDASGGMMEKMDMNGMMHECMEMHKDGKMCDHDMMAKCETKMDKGECQKMMKQAKIEHKKSKTK